MLTTQQIRWAASHDWFVMVDDDGVIYVRSDEDWNKGVRWTGTFRALRAWAGY